MENHFSFRSEAARQAILQQAAEHRGRHTDFDRQYTPEMVREFHYRVARYLDEQPDSSPQRVLFHGEKAGDRFALSLPKVILAAGEHDLSRSAYRRVKAKLDLWDKQVLGRVGSTLEYRVAVLRARWLRAVGGQDQRDEAIELLSKHVEAAPDPEQEYLIVRDLLEAIYEEKDTTEIEGLVKRCDQWLVSTQWRNPLTIICLRFYRELGAYKLAGSVKRSELGEDVWKESDQRLAELADQLKELPASRTSDLFLARVLQARAGRYWRYDPSSRDHFAKFCNASLALKRKHNETEGVALTLGQLGTFYVYYAQKLLEKNRPVDEGDLAEATALLDEDLTLSLEMDKMADCAGLYNRLAMAAWARSQVVKESDLKTQLVQEATELAIKSMSMALTLKREKDLAFAFDGVLTYASAHSDQASIHTAFDIVLNGGLDVFGKVPPGEKDYLRGKLAAMAEGLRQLGYEKQVAEVLAQMGHKSDVAEVM